MNIFLSDEALYRAVSRVGDMIGMMNSRMEEMENGGGAKEQGLLAMMQQQQQQAMAGASEMRDARTQAMLSASLGNMLFVLPYWKKF